MFAVQSLSYRVKRDMFIALTLLILVSGLALVRANSPIPNDSSPDVLVAGGGPAGIAAAYAAAKEGKTVTLVSETRELGGQMLNVGNMDGPKVNDTEFYVNWVERIKKFYNQKGVHIGTCYWNVRAVCAEPRVIDKISREMLLETQKVKILTGSAISASSENIKNAKGENVSKVTGIAFNLVNEKGQFNKELIKSKVTIDATELGDLLPLVNAPYRLSNGESNDPANLINENMCLQQATWAITIKEYPAGIPKDLKVTSPPPGYDRFKKRLETHLRQDDNNPNNDQIIFDPNDPIMAKSWEWKYHNKYRGLPNYNAANPKTSNVMTKNRTNNKINFDLTKTQSNFGQLVDIDMNVKDITNLAQRKKFLREMKISQFSFLYYIQNILHKNWSIADDEFNAFGAWNTNEPDLADAIEKRFPPIPYIREGRRLIGDETMTMNSTSRKNSSKKDLTNDPNTIAIGNYSFDIHGCNSPDTFESKFKESPTEIIGWNMGPFSVPLGALHNSKIEGFLVAEKNISATRGTNGATRLQPIAFRTGYAAGMIASFASDRGGLVGEVNSVNIQKRLVETGQDITIDVTIPVDNVRNTVASEILASSGLIDPVTSSSMLKEGYVQRGWFLKALVKTIEPNLAPTRALSSFKFVDVPSEDSHFFSFAKKQGITSGCTSTKLCYTSKITYRQMLVFLDNTLRFKFTDYPEKSVLSYGNNNQILKRVESINKFLGSDIKVPSLDSTITRNDLFESLVAVKTYMNK